MDEALEIDPATIGVDRLAVEREFDEIVRRPELVLHRTDAGIGAVDRQARRQPVGDDTARRAGGEIGKGIAPRPVNARKPEQCNGNVARRAEGCPRVFSRCLNVTAEGHFFTVVTRSPFS